MLKVKSLAKTIIFAFIVLIFITGCKPSDETSSKGITFTDALGRTVTVPQKPKRVAALLGSFADVWQLSGGTLCASVDDAWDDFDLDMGDAINIGKTKEPDLELLLSSSPDFVIASSSTAANVEMKDTLEGAGIPVAYFNVECFEDYLKMLDICTDITGRKDFYNENGIKIKEQIEILKQDFSKQNIPEEHKKVLFMRASAGYIRAKNSHGSILGEMLKESGCINIADNDKSLLENLSIESILNQNPYHIFFVQVGDDKDAVEKNIHAMMNETPIWYQLDAVRENRIHFMDKKLFNLKPNARWGEAYETLFNLLKE